MGDSGSKIGVKPPVRSVAHSPLLRITGDTRTFSLQHRICNGTLLLVAVAALLASGANVLLALPSWVSLSTAAVSLSHFALFSWSRRQRAFPAPGLISFGLLLLVLYPTLWHFNYGLTGGNQLVGMGLLVLATSTFEGKQRRVATTAVLIVTAALFADELPTISAGGYSSASARLIDNFITFIIVGMTMTMLGLVTEASFSHEREKARDYARVVERTNEQLSLALERNRLLAHTDALTQLPNRRYLEPIVARRVDESHRYRRPLSLAVVDIDHFKSVNDRFGHAVGDVILAGVAGVMRASIREVDVAARWGGEEFVVLCPETALDGAERVAERLRREVEALRFDGGTQVTISVGVAACEPTDDAIALFERADQALYEAKHQGRNRVVTCASAAPPPRLVPALHRHQLPDG